MHASAILAGLALCRAAAAVPSPEQRGDSAAAGQLQRREDLQTVPWVTVDDEGQPRKTITPSITTVSGTPSPIGDAAPHDLTASVYTWTTWGKITTSTGTPPNPTATSANTGSGAFSRCYNKDGEFAPFCRPLHNSTLLTGSTYYITWDPDFYNHTAGGSAGNNTLEVAVRLDYLNQSSNEMLKLDTFDRVPASWGFWPFKLEDTHLKGNRINNVTITLLSSLKGSNDKTKSVALPVALTRPGLDQYTSAGGSTRQNLLIALPVSLGGCALILIGLFLWNRKTRRIQLGNIMSRSRHGYTGRRHRGLFRKGPKDNGIQLDAAPLAPDSPPPTDSYRDECDAPGRPRRDSDALGSLAGSPVDPSFERQGTTGRNAFRDELRRQEDERRGQR